MAEEMTAEEFFTKYRNHVYGKKATEQETVEEGNTLERIQNKREKIKEENPALYEHVVQLLAESKKVKENKDAAVNKAKNAFKKNKNGFKKSKVGDSDIRNSSSLSSGSSLSHDSGSSQSQSEVCGSPTASEAEPYMYYRKEKSSKISTPAAT